MSHVAQDFADGKSYTAGSGVSPLFCADTEVRTIGIMLTHSGVPEKGEGWICQDKPAKTQPSIWCIFHRPKPVVSLFPDFRVEELLQAGAGCPSPMAFLVCSEPQKWL